MVIKHETLNVVLPSLVFIITLGIGLLFVFDGGDVREQETQYGSHGVRRIGWRGVRKREGERCFVVSPKDHDADTFLLTCGCDQDMLNVSCR